MTKTLNTTDCVFMQSYEKGTADSIPLNVCGKHNGKQYVSIITVDFDRIFDQLDYPYAD